MTKYLLPALGLAAALALSPVAADAATMHKHHVHHHHHKVIHHHHHKVVHHRQHKHHVKKMAPKKM